jgi:hypothetical protein
LADPEVEWSGASPLRAQLGEWTENRGNSPRLYPGSLVWCLKKPGRDLRDKVELALAWKRVSREVADGTLGGEFDRSDRADLQSKVKDADEAAKDAVWGDYRFAVVADVKEPDGLKVIDLGAGHSSSGGTLCGRVITALKSEALLNEAVSAGYIDRSWPPALRDSGAWPLASLRQSFLNGSLTRLLDPDTTLKSKIVEFVKGGSFGLASGQKPDGTFEHLWFKEDLASEEVAFEPDVFLLRRDTAGALKAGLPIAPQPPPEPEPIPPQEPGQPLVQPPEPAAMRTLRIMGTVPPEVWNRVGMKIIPKIRTGSELKIGVDFSVSVAEGSANSLLTELRQSLQELGLSERVKVE